MICPSCGTDTLAAAACCSACGQPLSTTESPTPPRSGVGSGVLGWVAWGLFWLGLVFVLLLSGLASVVALIFSYTRLEHDHVQFRFGPDGVPYSNEVPENLLAPDNAAILAEGLLATGVLLLTINRITRTRKGTGLFDWLMAKAFVLGPLCVLGLGAVVFRPLRDASPNLATTVLLVLGLMVLAVVVGVASLVRRVSYLPLPLLVLLGCLGLLAIGVFVDTRFHTDPEEAVAAFEAANVTHPRSTGNILFGQGEDGRTHLTWITPDLVRALDKHSFDIIPSGQKEREYPLPGWTPIAALLAVGVYAAVGVFRGGPAVQRRRARAALFFGLVNLFVVYWTIVGAAGSYTIPSDIWVPIFGLVFLGVAYGKLKDARLSSQARAGWTTCFFAIHQGIVAGGYMVSNKTPGTPALLWLLAYLVAGSLCWLLVLPSIGTPKPAPALQVSGGTNP